MFSRTSKKEDSEPRYILEIYEQHVVGSLVFGDRVLYSELVLQKKTHSEDEALLPLDATQKLLSLLETKGRQTLKKECIGQPVARVHVVYHAPWVTSYTKHFTLNKEASFFLKKNSLDAFLEKKVSETFTHDGDILHEHDLFPIEHVPLSMEVNGYQAPFTEDNHVRSFSAQYFFSAVPKLLLFSIEENIEKYLGVSLSISHHSHQYLFFAYLRAVQTNIGDALFITINRHNTEIIMARKNIIMDTHVFPVGVEALENALATVSKTIPQETKTYFKEKSGAPFSLHIKRHITSVGDVYKKALEEAYRYLEKYYVIPKHIVFLSPIENEVYFSHLLKQSRPNTKVTNLLKEESLMDAPHTHMYSKLTELGIMK